jgi:hypothetical protein
MTRELVLTRIFAVPIELVWRSWSDPGRMLRWWHAGGSDCTLINVTELVPLKRLVCVLRFPRSKGSTVMRSDIAFHDLGNSRTKVTITMTSQEQLEWHTASRRS